MNIAYLISKKTKKEFVRTRLNQNSKVINLNYEELINEYDGLIY